MLVILSLHEKHTIPLRRFEVGHALSHLDPLIGSDLELRFGVVDRTTSASLGSPGPSDPHSISAGHLALWSPSGSCALRSPAFPDKSWLGIPEEKSHSFS